MNARLGRFEEAGRCVIKAAEADQPEIIPSIHKYFHQLKENTKPFDMNCDRFSFDVPVEEEVLEKFFNNLTVKCQQSLFLINWKQIHEAIDSPLCIEMMPKQLTKDQKLKLQKFLHMALDWNVCLICIFALSHKINNLLFVFLFCFFLICCSHTRVYLSTLRSDSELVRLKLFRIILKPRFENISIMIRMPYISSAHAIVMRFHAIDKLECAL